MVLTCRPSSGQLPHLNHNLRTNQVLFKRRPETHAILSHDGHTAWQIFNKPRPGMLCTFPGLR
jgi:hypothetical protein